jgi:hypothetical protein
MITHDSIDDAAWPDYAPNETELTDQSLWNILEQLRHFNKASGALTSRQGTFLRAIMREADELHGSVEQ